MNQSNEMATLSLKIPDDVRTLLKAWAAHNVSSMTCELVRAVRERAEREQQKEAAR
ncbi:hypothetical protein [Bradyrhizobium sp. Arg816]|uniref:hypothetical protein n=1 Tax=Bradyrhizobium sp. Arg816 TaxID=2998491 RepID=UPI00249E2826|nr:hypothetical protein [Bradyrhizobium sp. Arg816]MDI3562463.1 hypothetical protein [Bradyrhizobium sp. Arg816]